MQLALERGQPGKMYSRVRQGNGLHPIGLQDQVGGEYER